MDSTLDFSVANADVLSMQLDRIVFSAMDTGDAISLGVTVYEGDSSTVLDEWFNTYYADHYGKVVIPDLASVWNTYILYRRRAAGYDSASPTAIIDGIKVKFTYTLEDETTATCNRRIWYSSRKSGMTVASLNTQAPFLLLTKKTFLDSKEFFWLVGPSSATVGVTVTYVLLDGVQNTTSFTLTATRTSNFGRSYDVSPSVASSQLSPLARMVEYTVKIGGVSVCRYIIESGHYPQRTEFCYLNRYGVYETLWLVGSETWKPERKAEFGWAGDEWIGLDVEVKDTYELSTGYVNDAVLEQLRDIMDSPLIWRCVPGGSWEKISVKGVALERTRPSNEARVGKVTYQLAERHAV